MSIYTFPFPITTDAKDRLEPALPLGLYDAYDKAYRLVERQSDKAVRKLRQLIAEHPRTPHFKLLLARYYDDAGKFHLTLAQLREVLDDFPTCLETRVDLVREALLQDDTDEALALLGPELQLTALHPRQAYYHADVANYYGAVAAWLLATGDAAACKEWLDLLKKEFAGLPEVLDAEAFILEWQVAQARLKLASLEGQMDLFAGGNEPAITGMLQPATETTEPPVFHHPEVSVLYEYDFSLPPHFIDTLLALPRQTLVADLHLMLADSRNRYTFFEAQDTAPNFLYHAIFLLAELEDSNSLPQVLHTLRNGDEFIDLYFGDLSTEGLWIALYRLALPDVRPLFRFVQEPNISTYGKVPVLQAIEQLYLQQPALQPTIRAEVQQLAAHFLAHASDPALADAVVGSDFTMLLLLTHGAEATDTIHELYDAGLASVSMLGTAAELLEDRPTEIVREVMDLRTLYHHIVTTWAGYTETEKLPAMDLDEADWSEPDWSDQEPEPLPAATVKVGRNDPCPCGSGKKYKKCCGKE